MEIPNSILGNAIRNKEIEMYLQFIVSAEDEKIIAAEALARWNCPGKGVLPPAAFLGNSMAREDGLALDLFMFEHVCEKLDVWKKRGWEKLQISCNFSRSDFSHSFLAEKMIDISKKYNFTPDRLIVEVTENAVEEVHLFTSRILRKLKEFGFRIALDDFGAGGTSIKDIQTLPLDILKLDRSLLLGARFPAGERVFSEVAHMGKRLHYSVICEGVETEAERQIAQRTGVDAVQGFMYYTPVSAREADRLLEQYYDWHETT